ncbi:MAG: glycine cleavage system protein GcvH [Chloroflexi bacterium]|nr:MAG: glycine cleavage system protein GcvH [Chloroflexota bacterium]
MKIDQYEFPDDLLYDKEHNWARIEGDTATLGLTAFGQDLAGEIVYAEVPRVGRDLVQGEPFMSLESGKWVGRVKAIVSGKIAEANEEIEWESSVINEDPYGAGWFAKVKLAGEPQGLFKTSDPEFSAWIAAERAKYGK